MKTIFFIFFFILGRVSVVNSQDNLPLNLKLNLKVLNVTKLVDLTIEIIFKNNGNTDLLITRNFVYGYKKGLIPYKPADFIWEVEKIKNKHYIQQSIDGILDEAPIFIPENELYDTLKPGQIISHKFRLNLFYQLGKGSYRVRAKYIIPLASRLPIKFMYSKWLKFNIKNTISFGEIE